MAMAQPNQKKKKCSRHHRSYLGPYWRWYWCGAKKIIDTQLCVAFALVLHEKKMYVSTATERQQRKKPSRYKILPINSIN